MTVRLSPAQQRVVDQMHDGAVLIQSDLFIVPDWWLALPGDTTRRVRKRVGWGLVSEGIVVQTGVTDVLSRIYVLAPEYREAT